MGAYLRRYRHGRPHGCQSGAHLRRRQARPPPYRPAHRYYIIKADGFETLTTHILDPDDPYIESDAVFGVKESLLAEFKKIDDPARARELGFDGPFFDVEHDFVLVRG